MASREAGFRRRILIEPAPGRVVAELEDDYHRMVVTLEHEGGVVSRVSSEMKRGPWTTCPGAMAQLEQTFADVSLAEFVRRGGKAQNCTHLYDLAIFGAAHADDRAAVAYDIFVTDPVDGKRDAKLWRDGALVLHWVMEGDRFLAPAALAGRTMKDLGDWIAAQDKTGAEAGRILRWACILAYGRAMDMPAGLSATAFPGASCYTFQPERAQVATRRPGADIDFSQPGFEPLADRHKAFSFGQNA
ncbi:MAG TPA: hypothetical protein VF489_01705 [Sphingobium sp.]